ncbi:MAG: type II toxin-antitoxin system VapC family toxin [Spirochaeta sp.]|nr:type II toxin-antitoxin system VapC family toxin [Spirochaeta sp.]
MYLIDTDIVIYSLKNDEQVKARFRETNMLRKSISVITYGELVYGARKSQYPEKNLATVSRVADIFPILGVSRSTMDVFGSLKASLEQAGTPIDDMDMMIAATALLENLILVTNNLKHFQRIDGLQIENWVTEESF